MKINIKKLHKDAVIPEYQTEGAAGFDLHTIGDHLIPFGQTVLVKTGLSVEIPAGYELQIRPRSGVSLKTKLRVANSPGTIDCDYRGEIGIIIDNIGEVDEFILKGFRIAQAVLCPIERAEFVEVVELSDTERGSGGFGSTNL